MIRQPAVAGQFYTGDGKELRAELNEYVPSPTGGEKALGIIAPHAGYIYSGAVAGKVYGEIEVPKTVIVLGPNHHGIGARAAIYPDGEWKTPLGRVSIDTRLSELVKRHSPIVEEDTVAHMYEHSLEVQVPFLQFVKPDVVIVPICLGFSDFPSCASLGNGIAEAIREYGDEVLIVASSDMTHYESAASAKAKDDEAIREILSLDPEGLLRVCRIKGITMCGVVPSTVMLVAAISLGAKKARLVKYSTSGDVTGDNRQVVAYAAFTVA
jgi:AmmeMemoRadiSam system protein B